MVAAEQAGARVAEIALLQCGFSPGKHCQIAVATKAMYSKALLASGLVALVLTVSLLFVSSGGRTYLSAVDWGQVNSMNYEEGQAYLVERSKETTRWQSLRNGVRYSEFWLSAFADWLLYSAVGFASCIVFLQLAHSKPPFKSGTRKRPPAP